MTREEALKKAINIVAYFEAHFAKSKEAREEATNIIEALEQETSDDAISRQAAIDALTKTSGIRGDALKALYDLPPVTPQPKMGHWIDITNKHGTVIAVRCSHCNESPKHAIKSDFCPNCGVKMGVKA